MRADPLRILIDARPLATDHRQRGIGTYVSGLILQVEKLRRADQLDGIKVGYLWPTTASQFLTGAPWRGADAPQDPPLVASPRAGDWHIYHATTIEGIALTPAFRTIVTLHDLIPLRQADWLRRARHLATYLSYVKQLRLLARASHIIAVSQATRRDAGELLDIPSELMTVIPPGLDTARGYIPTDEQRTDTQTTLGLEEPYFLAIASSDRNKNLARVLEAFAAFRDESDAGVAAPRGYRLYLVGSWMGREAQRIQRLIAQLRLRDVTQHFPWVPIEHMASLYAGATALIFPSLMEGFGYPALEAMACGTPVITSNRSSLPEVTGDAALYVTPENIREIVAAMRRLAATPELRATVVAKGYERSREFGLERMTRETIAVYRRVVAGDQT
jgi:glycosyltransferase involved in cell wall biosynthesis